MADLLVYFPSGCSEPLVDSILGYKLQANLYEKEEEWILEFDGSSFKKIRGMGVMLSRKKEKLVFVFKLGFICSNNEALYEAVTLGLLETLKRGIIRLCINGDSNLVIKQLNGDYAIKHIHLTPYQATVQNNMWAVQFNTNSKATTSSNKHPDVLATIANKIVITARGKHNDYSP